MLQSLLWPDEVRDASFPALDTSIRISAQEREMSAALVESMAADFEPEHFTDDYQVQLRKLIEAKLEKGDSLDTDETFGAEAGGGGNGEVIDLMEALKRSLERKRGGGKPAASEDAASEDADAEDADDAGTGESADSPGGKAPAKAGAKTAETRTTSAKTAPAKSTETKTAAAKPAAKATTTRARKGA
ncbi:probable DNA repair protein Lxx15680 [Arthrobacter sp. Hiyo4]|nr:probable DNA repair protein Lxx15680 [Arthrobacter sp. Hiyo4]